MGLSQKDQTKHNTLRLGTQSVKIVGTRKLSGTKTQGCLISFTKIPLKFHTLPPNGLVH